MMTIDNNILFFENEFIKYRKGVVSKKGKLLTIDSYDSIWVKTSSLKDRYFIVNHTEFVSDFANNELNEFKKSLFEDFFEKFYVGDEVFSITPSRNYPFSDVLSSYGFDSESFDIIDIKDGKFTNFLSFEGFMEFSFGEKHFLLLSKKEEWIQRIDAKIIDLYNRGFEFSK